MVSVWGWFGWSPCSCACALDNCAPSWGTCHSLADAWLEHVTFARPAGHLPFARSYFSRQEQGPRLRAPDSAPREGAGQGPRLRAPDRAPPVLPVCVCVGACACVRVHVRVCVRARACARDWGFGWFWGFVRAHLQQRLGRCRVFRCCGELVERGRWVETSPRYWARVAPKSGTIRRAIRERDWRCTFGRDGARPVNLITVAATLLQPRRGCCNPFPR